MLARVESWVVCHTLEELAQNLPHARARWNAELFHDVVAVDQEVLEREGGRGADLLLHALPKGFERVHPRRTSSASDVVGLTKREQRGDVLEPDLANEAA